MEKKMKLKKLVEQFIEEQEIDEQAFLESVSNYSSYGKEIYREHDIIETAKKLSEIARVARIHTVRETEDNFDKITVNRNMKELGSIQKNLKKLHLKHKDYNKEWKVCMRIWVEFLIVTMIFTRL